jgi:hypothetical protein
MKLKTLDRLYVTFIVFCALDIAWVVATYFYFYR